MCVEEKGRKKEGEKEREGKKTSVSVRVCKRKQKREIRFGTRALYLYV